MKVFISAIAIFTAIIILICIHYTLMINLANEINKNCDIIWDYTKKDDWESAVSQIDKVKKIWASRRTWAALTISTEEIEQIEISLIQSQKYAQLHQKADFTGEFTMFEMLVQHIPHQEGFHIAEIL